jgi:hypothetical protein
MKKKNWEIHYINGRGTSRTRKCDKEEAFKRLEQPNVTGIRKSSGFFKRSISNPKYNSLNL